MENYVTKPWGEYTNILEEEYCKVKKILIKPGNSPSYQYHLKRSETWVFVKGKGTVILDDEECKVSAGDILTIGVKQKHRVINTSNSDDLIFIEIQTGEYFGEDDIVRLEDKYGRI